MAESSAIDAININQSMIMKESLYTSYAKNSTHSMSFTLTFKTVHNSFMMVLRDHIQREKAIGYASNVKMSIFRFGLHAIDVA